MKKKTDILFSLLADFIAFHAAFFIWWTVRLRFGFYAETDAFNYCMISLVVSVYWVTLFLFFGMYRNWKLASRIDELIDVFRVICIGVVIILAATFDFQRGVHHALNLSRFLIVVYWFVLVLCIGGLRMVLHTVQRKLLESGYGRKRALIIGWDENARTLYDQMVQAPALGYTVVGFVAPGRAHKKAHYKRVPVVGVIQDLHRIVQTVGAEEVVIALPRRSEKQLEQVIGQCGGLDVGMKMVPDLYDVMVGQVRTNQIYGFPLIEILPQLITPTGLIMKRTGDIVFSLVLLTCFLPFGILLAAAIKVNSRGPIFYMQERVGKNGKTFRIIKFRSMVKNAEVKTGPVWAADNDPRVTAIGKWMRKLRLDEVPQLFNVLRGDMSLVGPRPERPFFVEKLKKAHPLYARRLGVRPGITGWAQIKGEYDQTIEGVKEKIEYDLFYLENMSPRMDMKILLSTAYVVLKGKGK
jgi:exopolysaccharide biosynthesis polyprenyl glycosylphosphotransferase